MSVPRFPRAAKSYDERNEAAFRQELENAFRDFARQISSKPIIRTEVSASGADRTVTHTLIDPLRQFLTIEWRVDGGSWSATWTTEVTRSSYAKTVTLTAGKDAVYEYRMHYKDEGGRAQYTGETLPLTHLRSVAKTIRIGASDLKPDSNTTTWVLSPSARPNAVGTTELLVAAVVIPIGVTVDVARARMNRNAVGDTALVAFRRISNTGVASTLATLTHDTTGWQTKSASGLAELTAGEDYEIVVQLSSTVSVTDALFRYFEIDYTVPSYDKTY